MNRLPTLLLTSTVAFAALVAASPVAAEVYKVVGPDGRITYSDKRPSDLQQQATVIGSAGQQRLLIDAASAPAGPPRMYLPPASNADIAARRAIASGARSAPSGDLALIEGLVAVGGYETLVHSYLEVCSAAMTSSVPRFQAMARNWTDSNAAVLKQASDLRSNLFSTQQQAAIQAAGQARAEFILAPVRASALAARFKWCNESSDAIKNGLLSLSTKASVNQGFERYVTR